MRKELLALGLIAGVIELSQYAFTAETKETIRKRQGYCCAECGKKGHTEVHHKVPQAMGGSDEMVNGVALCPQDHDKWDELAREGIIYPGIPIAEASNEQWKSLKVKEKLFARQGGS